MAKFSIKGKEFEISIKGSSKFVLVAVSIISFAYVSVNCPDYILQYGLVVLAPIMYGFYLLDKQEHLRLSKSK